MVNLFSALKGLLYYFMGIAYCLVSYWVGRAFVPTLGTVNGWDLSGNQNLIWWGLVISWVLAMAILPSAKIYSGLMEKSDQNKILGITGGVLWAILALAFTITGWFMITGLATIFEIDTVLYGIFWISTLTIWLLLAIIGPYMQITKNTTHD